MATVRRNVACTSIPGFCFSVYFYAMPPVDNNVSDYHNEDFKVFWCATSIEIIFIAVLLIAFIEEQARWFYGQYSKSVVRSQVVFSSVVTVMGFIGFYDYKELIPLYIYAVVKPGAIFAQSINGLLSIYSFRLPTRGKLLLFSVAVAFHGYMSMGREESLFLSILPDQA